MSKSNIKSKIKIPQDMLIAKQNLVQAIDEGFDFSIKENGKSIDCIGFLAILASLVEYRPLLKSNDYWLSLCRASSMSAKKVCSDLHLDFSESFEQVDIYVPFFNKLYRRLFTSSRVKNWAEVLFLISVRFKFPICNRDTLIRIFAILFQLEIAQGCKSTAFDLTTLEIFDEKSVTCCVNFMEDCMNGVDYKEAQKHLNSGLFSIMRLGENQSRHLSKEGRQFMRFAAVLLYKLYGQYKSLQYNKMFKDVDLHILMQTAGIGRVDWLYDFLIGKFDAEDTRYIALCALHCEPKGYTIKVSEKKIEEYARISRMYHMISLLNYSISLAVENNLVVLQVGNLYKDKVSEGIAKANEELNKRVEELRTLQSDLKNKNTEIRSLNKQLETLSMECSVLVNENAVLTKKVEDLSAEDLIKRKDELILSLQESLRDCENELQSCTVKLDSAKKRVKTLEGKSTSIADNAVELEKYKKRVQDLEETLESFVKEDVGVSFDEMANYCRGIKPFIVGGLKGLDGALNKVFKDYVYYNIEDGSAELVVPSNIDCVLIYTRFVGHQHVNAVRSRMPDNIPYIPLNNSNPDLIRKTVYKALKVKD